MAKERISMRKIKEILRLKSLGLSNREISRSINVARSTVSDYLSSAKVAGISWPLDKNVDDSALKEMLFGSKEVKASGKAKPDYEYIHKELKKKGVTLRLLWEEYLISNPNSYRYTQFCHHYRNWAGHLKLSLRQVYKAGEKMFVDYAGVTMPIVNSDTGEITQAQIFVSVLGASDYIFCEASQSQDLSCFLTSHVRAFNFYGGATKVIIPDNLKSAVSKPCCYEPDINPAYNELAIHYGTSVIPARVARPKDKAKVEQAVQMVERWVLAPLRKCTFFSITELNKAIREGLIQLNNRPFSKMEGSRRQLFAEIEKDSLMRLPQNPYEFASWKCAKVNIDYHIEVKSCYYSVPNKLVKRKVDVRFTKTVVEIFYNSSRVALHPRLFKKGSFSTIKEHMPKSHQRYMEWSPSKMISWAKRVGPNCAGLVEAILESRVHPEQGFRSCLGVIRLSKSYPKERVEAASKRALEVGALSSKSVKSILEKNLDLNPLAQEDSVLPLIKHGNIRGANYYQLTKGDKAKC